jgi:hypothetical protein
LSIGSVPLAQSRGSFRIYPARAAFCSVFYAAETPGYNKDGRFADLTKHNLPPNKFNMFRFAIVTLLVLFLPFISSQSGDFSSCLEILSNVSECFTLNNITTQEPNADTSSCIACFTNKNFFENYDQTKASCSTAKSEICGFLDKCQDACFPTVNGCQDEYDAYYECIFGISYAPDGCLVQCDGTRSDGNSNTNGGTNNSVSSSSMNGMSLIGSSIVLVVAIVGNGLVGNRI